MPEVLALTSHPLALRVKGKKVQYKEKKNSGSTSSTVYIYQYISVYISLILWPVQLMSCGVSSTELVDTADQINNITAKGWNVTHTTEQT